MVIFVMCIAEPPFLFHIELYVTICTVSDSNEFECCVACPCVRFQVFPRSARVSECERAAVRVVGCVAVAVDDDGVD